MSTSLITPQALLLDFGGVIATNINTLGWEDPIAVMITELLTEAGVEAPSHDRIIADIKAGRSADSHWKNAMSRHRAPRELTHEEFWCEFVACDWEESAREVLHEHAGELCLEMGRVRQRRELRPGMIELLDYCRQQQIPVAIASNALCGEVHREFLATHELSDYFVAECYSDELRVRKPNPALLEAAAAESGVPISECWYVGDTVDRDVVACQRSGVGAGITMDVSTVGEPLYPTLTWLKSDALVADPHELLTLLKTHVGTVE
ncbi:MAG: HAD family hydrolase [Corynebacterium sp.]|nr:HAD family hydrolase [Corynebacterium sp.]